MQAITHSSYANEHKPLESNERLEFLGDAVLELTVSRYLYHCYPQYAEGELTKIRQSLVCEDTLAEIANSVSLGEYLSVGKARNRAAHALAHRSLPMQLRQSSPQQISIATDLPLQKS